MEGTGRELQLPRRRLLQSSLSGHSVQISCLVYLGFERRGRVCLAGGERAGLAGRLAAPRPRQAVAVAAAGRPLGRALPLVRAARQRQQGGAGGVRGRPAGVLLYVGGQAGQGVAPPAARTDNLGLPG